MRRFALLLSLLPLFSLAQIGPVIEGTYLPVRNTSILQCWDTVAPNIQVPTEGQNMTWDYSNSFTNVIDTFELRTYDAYDTPHSSHFPDATHAAYWRIPFLGQDSMWVYFYVDTLGLHRNGGFSERTIYDTTIVMDPIEFMMPATCYYGMDTVEDFSISEAYAFISGFNFKVRSHRTKFITCPAYGSLTTPMGSFNDVVLIKEEYATLDTVYIDFMGTGNWSVYDSYPTSGIYWQYLRNNTFASTHLMFIRTDPANTFTHYGWYTLPVDIGHIEGMVYDTTGLPITEGEMYLYREYSNFTKNDILATTAVDVNGNYRFDSIPYGTYRIACRADINTYPNSLTTYYGDDTDWIMCDTVVTTSDTSGIEINIKYHDPVAGNNQMIGLVEVDLGYGKTAGDPVPGVDITLEQVPGGLVDNQDRTGLGGSFHFDQLHDGDYTMWVDIPGLHMAGTYDIHVENGDVVECLNFTVGMDSIYPVCQPHFSKIVGYSAEEKEYKIYPNPNNGSFTLDYYGGEFAVLDVRIFDALGRTVHMEQFTNAVRNQAIDFDGKSGYYHIQIIADGVSLGLKKLIVK